MRVTGSKHTSYNLSIRLKADGFSFLVTEGFSGDNLLNASFSVEQGGQTLCELLREKLCMQELRSLEIGRVRVVTCSDATSVPQEEFDVAEIAKLHALVFPQKEDGEREVCYTNLAQLNVVVVFDVEKDIAEVIREVYPEASFTNVTALAMGRIATYYKRHQLSEDSLFAYVTPEQMFLFSLKEDKLRIANTFPLDQPQDSQFFLLATWKMLGLDARKSLCYVAGEEQSTAFLKEALEPFLKNVVCIFAEVVS